MTEHRPISLQLPERADGDAYRAAVFLEPFPFADHLDFVVITAWNPPVAGFDQRDNPKRDKDLHSRLVQLGVEAVRVTGTSQDLAHAEPGWAAAVSLDVALPLARDFQEAAIFAVRTNDLYLVWSDGTQEHLGPARPRFGRGGELP